MVDGGFLLHRVLWQAKESFSVILSKYVQYAKRHFNEGSVIVFVAAKSIKSVERIRRTKKHIAGYVMFDETMAAAMSQEKFLSNSMNKQRLISMLCIKLQNAGFAVKQSEEDADYLIIKSALELEKSSQCVVVVGEDIDLLIIMAVSTNSETIFFLKPGKGKAEDSIYCAEIRNVSQHIRDNILFLHAFSGCDTTSALFRQGKKKFVNILNNPVVKIFNCENACPDDIDKAGQKVLIALYGGWQYGLHVWEIRN